MSKRSAQPVTAALLTLTVLISVSTVSGAVFVCATPAATIGNQSERDPAGGWLTSLTNAAKRMHGQAVAWQASEPRYRVFAFELNAAVVHPREAVLPQPTLISTHLIDLPPPAV